MDATISLGDWVRDRYDRTGRVTALHARCPESDFWLNRQEMEVTPEQRSGAWVSILVDGGGLVVQPIGTVAPVDDPGRPLNNTWTDHYFEGEVNR